MSPLDAFWHLLNFLAPAIAVGGLASLLAKLVFRRDLKRTGWMKLWLWAAVCSAAVLLAGLMVFGHDGTYVAMVAACAASLWWVGLRRR